MRKLSLLFLFMVILVLALAACGGDSEEEEAAPAASGGDAAAGESLFASTCAACHGADAKGLPALGKDLTTSEFVDVNSDDDFVAFIKIGRPAGDPENTTGVDMPPKGGNPALDDEDILNIVAYVQSIHE